MGAMCSRMKRFTRSRMSRDRSVSSKSIPLPPKTTCTRSRARSRSCSRREHVRVGDVHGVAGGELEEILEGGAKGQLVRVALDVPEVRRAKDVIHRQERMRRAEDGLLLVDVDG